jgi:hypothetical protein
MAKFVFIENRFNKETLLFESFVNNIKNELNSKTYDDNDKNGLSNSVIVYSPLLDVPIVSISEEIKIVVQFVIISQEVKEYIHYSYVQNLVQSVLDSTGKYFRLNDINRYILKIHGKEEYLPTDALLCELKYIRDCVCLNMNPVFVLVRVEYVNRHLSLHKVINSKLYFNQLKSDFKFKLDENNYKLMNRNGLEKILNSIIENKNKIEEVIKQNDKVMLLFYCLKFRNDFKELMSLVSNIQYTPFLMFNEWMEGKETIMKNQLLKKLTSIEKDEIESIRKAVENFMESCIKFCNYGSTFFYWPFKLKEINKIEEVKFHKLNDSKEKIRIYVESLSNLSDLMNFETKYKYFYNDNFSLESIFITFKDLFHKIINLLWTTEIRRIKIKVYDV